MIDGAVWDNESWNQSYADTKYVPYTGATQDVNLSYRNITSNIYYFNRNESLGIWSNTTDTVIGFIGGLP